MSGVDDRDAVECHVEISFRRRIEHVVCVVIRVFHLNYRTTRFVCCLCDDVIAILVSVEYGFVFFRIAEVTRLRICRVTTADGHVAVDCEHAIVFVTFWLVASLCHVERGSIRSQR